MNFNKVIFAGRLVRDPEIKDVGETKVAKLRIISNRIYFKGRGDKKEKCEEAIAMNAEIWGGRSKAAEYLSKGDSCLVEGYIKEDSWEDGDGNKRYSCTIKVDELVFGEKAKGNKSSDTKKPEPKNDEEPEQEQVEDADSEEVPF